MQNNANEKIDCEKKDYLDTIEMVEKCYKKEDFDYHKQYIKFK